MKDINEKERDAQPQPKPGDAERLLSRIMTELDMDPQALTRRRSYRRLMLRHSLPRIAAVVLVCAIVLLLVWSAVRPPEAGQIRFEKLEDGVVRVFFEVKREFIIRHLYADIDGRPLYIAWHNHEHYVDVEENGTLTLEAVTILGVRSSLELVVDEVDEEAPYLVGDVLEDGELTLYLSDGDGAGIAWDQIRVYAAETREEYPVLACDPEAGFIRLALPEIRINIYVPDLADNQLTVELEPIK